MSAGIGSDLFRTVFAVLIGVLVAYTGLPDTAKAHVTETDKLHVSHDDRGPAADHHSDTAPTFGHCHPGLDCFTAAAFLLDPSLPTQSNATFFRTLRSLQDKGYVAKSSGRGRGSYVLISEPT